MKTKTITVEVSPSTLRWLHAFAKPQRSVQRAKSPGELLAQAAFCIADYAGRRPGSWEASVAESMMVASGWQNQTVLREYHVCKELDACEHASFRSSLSHKTKSPGV